MGSITECYGLPSELAEIISNLNLHASDEIMNRSPLATFFNSHNQCYFPFTDIDKLVVPQRYRRFPLIKGKQEHQVRYYLYQLPSPYIGKVIFFIRFKNIAHRTQRFIVFASTNEIL